MAKPQKVVTMAMAGTVTIGVLSAAIKEKEWPSRSFIVGSGIAWLGLTALADVEPELAQPLAVAVLVTAIIGDGGGILTFLTPKDELNLSKKAVAKAKGGDSGGDDAAPPAPVGVGVGVGPRRAGRRPVTTTVLPGVGRRQVSVIPAIPGIPASIIQQITGEN